MALKNSELIVLIDEFILAEAEGANHAAEKYCRGSRLVKV